MESREKIILGKWSKAELDKIIIKGAHIGDTGTRIEYLSAQFLGIPYKESTLAGDIHTPEMLIINLREVDCFTFIDYVEAMRCSRSFLEFKEILRKVRYKNGIVLFQNRNHFFTDWPKFNKDFVSDVTESIGRASTRHSKKTLNKKEDGAYYLEGISPVMRTVRYIPTAMADNSILEKLHTGDYVGIYTNADGLDVSHVGIIVQSQHNTIIRHASSTEHIKKVVNQEFKDYIAAKPGFMVLRPQS